MNSKMSTAAIGAFAFTVALAGCGGSEEPNGAETPDEQAAEEVSADHNDADVEYLTGMIPHHQQAYEMSGMLLEKDNIETEVAALAEDIREAQGPEIEQMESWLDAWGESSDGADHDEMGHEGMMSEEELTDLEESTGTEASRLFLEQMIVHHEGAVSSAEQHLQDGENPEALELSEDIIADQQAEIDQMEEILESL